MRRGFEPNCLSATQSARMDVVCRVWQNASALRTLRQRTEDRLKAA